MKNIHNVPAHIWARWSETARSVFTIVFELMQADPDSYQHPDVLMTREHWETTAWNAAWTAAEAADGNRIRVAA